jgi:hypothetical protein
MRVFVFEGAAREQRDADQRDPVRLLVLEFASDVSLRGRKEDEAEDSAVHGRNRRRHSHGD